MMPDSGIGTHRNKMLVACEECDCDWTMHKMGDSCKSNWNRAPDSVLLGTIGSQQIHPSSQTSNDQGNRGDLPQYLRRMVTCHALEALIAMVMSLWRTSGITVIA